MRYRTATFYRLVNSGIMTRYYFNIIEDGVARRDDEGTELLSIDAARLEATQTIRDLARDRIPTESSQHRLQHSVRVRAGNAAVMTLHLAFNVEIAEQ